MAYLEAFWRALTSVLRWVPSKSLVNCQCQVAGAHMEMFNTGVCVCVCPTCSLMEHSVLPKPHPATELGVQGTAWPGGSFGGHEPLANAWSSQLAENHTIIIIISIPLYFQWHSDHLCPPGQWLLATPSKQQSRKQLAVTWWRHHLYVCMCRLATFSLCSETGAQQENGHVSGSAAWLPCVT